jgi:hypothetical protein
MKKITGPRFKIFIPFVISFIAIISAVAILMPAEGKNLYEVEINFYEPIETKIELFYDIADAPRATSLNASRVAKFEKLPNTDFLRIDPANYANFNFSIDEVNFYDNDKKLIKSYTGSEFIDSADMVQCSKIRSSEGRVFLKTLGDDCQIIANALDLPIQEMSFFFQQISKLKLDFVFFSFLILSFLIMIAIFEFVNKKKSVKDANFILVTLVCIGIALVVTTRFPKGGSFDAVGYNIFTGNSPYASTSFLLVSTGLLFLFYVSKVILSRFRMSHALKSPNVLFEDVRLGVEKVPVTNVRKFNFLPGVILFLYILKSSESLTDSIPNKKITDWDSANIETWSILIAKGLTPLKDFYYPYENLFLINPWSPLGNLFYASICGFTLFGFINLYGKSLYSYLLIGSTTTWVLITNPSFGVRYLLPILCFASCHKYAFTNQGKLLAYTSTFICLFLSFQMSIYFVFGAITVFVLSFLFIDRRLYLSALKRFLILLLSTFLSVAVILALQGTLMGRISFYLDSSGLISYAANNTLFSNGFGIKSVIVFFLEAFPLFVVSYSLSRLVNFRNQIFLYLEIIGVSIVVLLVLQKHLTRENSNWYLPIAIVLVGVLLILREPERALSGVLSFQNVFRALSFGLLCGFFFLFSSNFLAFGSMALTEDFKNKLIQLPRVVDNMSLYTKEIKRRGRVEEIFPIEAAVLNAVPALKSSKYVVVGDAPGFYALNSSNIPWVTDMWSLNPRNLQLRFIKDAEPAEYLIYLDSPDGFDGVEFSVREPIVYRWMITNFDYSRSVILGRYHVVPRGKNSASTWPTVELNFGSIFNVAGSRVCKSGDECDSAIQLTSQEPGWKTFDIIGTIDNQRHKVNFYMSKNRVYTIPVSNIFFNYSKSTPKIIDTTNDLNVKIVQIIERDGLF